MTDADKKRRIAQRLRAYRDANGRGCFTAVAKATNGRIRDTDIHEIMMGSGRQRLMKDWNAVDMALDRLEGKT